MINLIPNQEKKKMQRIFYYRLAVVFLVVLGIAFLGGSASLLSVYFASSAKAKLAETKLATQRAEPVPSLDQNNLAEIQTLALELDIVEKVRQNKFHLSDRIIRQVLAHRTPDIKITEINYTGVEISLSGIAPSRERLLAFRRSLENDVSFEKINLPISNFIKGSNIQFSLTLVPGK